MPRLAGGAEGGNSLDVDLFAHDWPLQQTMNYPVLIQAEPKLALPLISVAIGSLPLVSRLEPPRSAT